MTDQEINIAIAEACGWHRLTGHGDSETWAPKGWVYGKDIYGKLRYTNTLPDYCHDLNAMHEAEKTLTDDQQESYVRFLAHGVMTTSHQRAEAFLRTLGKWKE